jgi:O-antigen/teichoic acid export membrane protein
MNKKIKDFSYALGANILTFVMGIVTGFLIPKFLGIEDYAYIKIFSFYLGYVGILHFGFLDGIYIKFGSYDYEQLPKEKFRGYFRFLFLFQVIEAIILSVVVYLFVKDVNRSSVLYSVIINIIIVNITTTCAYIHQFTKRFKLFSINTVLAKFIYVLGCLVFFALHIYSFNEYIILQTVVNVVILLIYVWYNKEIIIGSSESVKENFGEYFSLIKNGLFVMLGNLMTIIILGIDRFFVDRFFTIKDFAMYSFAYTLVSLFYILLNSLTMVLYPYLTRAKEDTYKTVYEKIRMSISILMGTTLAGYFFIKIVVIKFVPQYVESFNIIIFLIPTLIFSAHISILIANFYKVLNKTKDYTKNNIVALFLGIIANFIGYFIYKDVVSISIATLIAFIIWVLYSDMYFKKKLGVDILKSQIFDILIVIIFIVSAISLNWYIGLIVYCSSFIIIIALKYKAELKDIIKMVKSK